MSDNENKVNELNEALKGMWDSLSDEQKEKAKECKSMDELMSLAGKMRIELPDELLESVAGGLIVKTKTDCYYIMDDNDINIRLGYHTYRDHAAATADFYKVSRKTVSEEEYRAMGGKAKLC